MNAQQIDQQTLLKDEADPLTHTPVHLLSWTTWASTTATSSPCAT
jgi:hypothetical protein